MNKKDLELARRFVETAEESMRRCKKEKDKEGQKEFKIVSWSAQRLMLSLGYTFDPIDRIFRPSIR